MSKTKPILIFGYGNPSRGDDALGPLLIQYIEDCAILELVELQTDFQLQIEHALDLENRQLVLFVDASVACTSAYDFSELEPTHDKSYTTHAMSPGAVLQVYQDIKHSPPPPCFLLSIQGNRFELGEDLSETAKKNLAFAKRFTESLLDRPSVDNWRQLTDSTRH